MKTAIGWLICAAALLPAQGNAPSSVKRLDSVTWDLKTHKLVWVVQTGNEEKGSFVPSASAKYEISPNEAVMASGEEKRGFTQEEAASLNDLLNVLSLYCAESTVWWDQGQGTRVDKKTTAPGAPAGKPVRVVWQGTRPLPANGVTP
jgi:hypothetical protein